MAHAKRKAIVRPGIIFHKEGNPCPCSDKTFPPDPDSHPLFGESLKNPHWPGTSEYADKYCASAGGQPLSSSRKWHQQTDYESRREMTMDCLPWPCGPQIASRHRDRGQDEYRLGKIVKAPQRIDELYDPTPLPAVEKRYRGYYYHIDDPIGKAITTEEITKCRDTVFGPVMIRLQDEISDIYVPNYRYLEWVSQPQIEILKQNEMTSPLCRMPEVDSRHYDFYHQVRNNRPVPHRDHQLFGTCAVIPLPRNDSEFNVSQMLV